MIYNVVISKWQRISTWTIAKL